MHLKPNYCVICGAKKTHKVHQTCGHPMCSAMVLVNPRYRDDRIHRKSMCQLVPSVALGQGIADRIPKHIQPSPAEQRLIDRMLQHCDFDLADWSIHGFILNDDIRGSALARDTIWGFLTRRRFFVKAQGKLPGQPSMRIRKFPWQTVHEYVRREWIGRNLGSPMEEAVDGFYAWRCKCPTQYEVIYERVEDLPNTAGYHDPCPQCGASPLEVKDYGN